MNIRQLAAADVQHGLEALPTKTQTQGISRNENLVLNVRNQPDLDNTRATKHSASLARRSKETESCRPHSSTDIRNCTPKLEDTTMTCARIEAYLEPETLRRLQIPSIHLTYLWSANVDPPVTVRSLSELDLVRIIHDAKLRHDLNFEREISFRPNIDSPRCQQKEAVANAYWEALTIEFALYIKYRHNLVSNRVSAPPLPWISETPNSPRLPTRLPRMFVTIRDVLKTLVPGSECSAVDQRLDIDLLMQELENGACDVKGLSNWLRQLLLGSCSPLRDTEVEKMANIVHEGVDKDDARILVSGLKVLFGILEIMKLDVANHQIRYLRLLMVEDSIHFEQNTFLRRISEGFDVRDARDWYDYHSGEEVDGYMNFARGVWDMIVDGRVGFPTTFCHDIERLLVLQRDFRMELFQEACGQSFIDTLHTLGWTGTPPYETYDMMLTRVIAVLKDSRDSDYNREVALEVVREAYRLCNMTTLPDERFVDVSRLYLQEASKPTSSIFQRLHGRLSFALAELMDEEVEILMDLTPLQMLDYLHPESTHNNNPSEAHGLVNIAKRTAHIAVLHWKTWGPILYEQPSHNIPSAPELPECSDVLSKVGLTPHGTPFEVVEDGPRPRTSRETSTLRPRISRDSSTETVLGSIDLSTRSTSNANSERG